MKNFSLRFAAIIFSVLCVLTVWPANTTQAAQRPESFADLAEQLLPAVVNISTEQEVQAQQFGGFPQFPPGSPFENFFEEFFGDRGIPGFRPPGQNEAPKRKVTSLGSGFIVSPDGLVVTNSHVIAQADQIKVILHDESEIPAEVIGVDQKTDLALLKIETSQKLPFVSFGDSDVSRVGDWVLAIGNPFGLGGSVTAGIISARARDINAGPYDDFIQTDAPINRGNSGGPLFNLDGQVIGINTAIFSPNGGSIGIGFAIPANMARDVVDQIKTFGRTKRGWLGVRIQEMTPDLAESLGLPEPTGALITSVAEEGPADEAGFEAGDVILSFSGQEILTMRDLPRIVAATPINETVRVEVLRQGGKKTLKVTLGDLEKAEKQMEKAEEVSDDKDMDGADEKDLLLGMRLSTLNEGLRKRYRLSNDVTGVVVTGVKRTSAAAEKGIRPGDVIVEALYRKIKTPSDLEEAVEKAQSQGKPALLMRVVSQGTPRFVVVKLKDAAEE